MSSYYILGITVLYSLAAWYVSPDLMKDGMLRPYYTFKENRWYQLLTSGFLHADFTHLLFNMITFFFFGPPVERIFGTAAFVGLYVVSLIASSLPTLFRHKNNPNYASLGASGAVEAVLFSYIIFNPWQTLIVFVIPVPAIIFAFLFVAYSIYAGKQRADGDNVNHEAHIAGGVTGIIYTIILIPDAVQIFLNNLLGGF